MRIKYFILKWFKQKKYIEFLKKNKEILRNNLHHYQEKAKEYKEKSEKQNNKYKQDITNIENLCNEIFYRYLDWNLDGLGFDKSAIYCKYLLVHMAGVRAALKEICERISIEND